MQACQFGADRGRPRIVSAHRASTTSPATTRSGAFWIGDGLPCPGASVDVMAVRVVSPQSMREAGMRAGLAWRLAVDHSKRTTCVVRKQHVWTELSGDGDHDLCERNVHSGLTSLKRCIWLSSHSGATRRSPSLMELKE